MLWGAVRRHVIRGEGGVALGVKNWGGWGLIVTGEWYYSSSREAELVYNGYRVIGSADQEWQTKRS